MPSARGDPRARCWTTRNAPTAQSLLKLFKPSNPNFAQTCLPCLTHSFLEKPQHMGHAPPSLLLPPDHHTLPGGPAVWLLLLGTASSKCFLQGSRLQVCHLHIPDKNKPLIHFNTGPSLCVHSFSQERRGCVTNLYSQEMLPTRGYPYPLRVGGTAHVLPKHQHA